jgi:uncharacterized protein YkwD
MRQTIILVALALAVGVGSSIGVNANVQDHYESRGKNGRAAERLPRPENDREHEEIAELEYQCFEAVNKQREIRGLRPLDFNPELLHVAREYSRRMADERFFDHVDPVGQTVRDRLRDAGLKWRILGENLAYSKGYVNPVASAMRGWMDSPGHRKNILEPDFRETAVGAWISSGGTIYFTEIFIR